MGGDVCGLATAGDHHTEAAFEQVHAFYHGRNRRGVGPPIKYLYFYRVFSGDTPTMASSTKRLV